jgi:hypothetical protein
MWFVERPNQDRRKPANRLKRAVREAEMLEERQIDYWLELGKAALDGHDAARFRRKDKPTERKVG